MEILTTSEMIHSITFSLILMATLFMEAALGQSEGLDHKWGPGISVDHFNDQTIDKNLSNKGVELMFYNAMSDKFHGYATMDMFFGKLKGLKTNYLTASVALLYSPFGQKKGILPYAGAAAALCGVNNEKRWTPAFVGGLNFVASKYSNPTPYLRIEYYTKCQRTAFSAGVMFPFW
jgi:hypothetical protein